MISPEVPRPDRHAGWHRLHAILELLARHVDIALVGRTEGPAGGDPYVAALAALGVEVHATETADLAALLRRTTLGVWFEFFLTAEQHLEDVRVRRPDLPVVVDSVDLHFVREERMSAYAAAPDRMRAQAARTRRRELGIYGAADVVVTATDHERHVLLGALRGTRVVTVPMIYAPWPDVPALAQRTPGSLLFVGGFRHSPNVDAVQFLCRDVMPHLRRLLPDARLTVVGDSPPPEIDAVRGDDVTVTGYVADLVPFLATSAVSVAPLRYGAGMKGKVIEAMAAGVPVVTTSVGAEGIGMVHGETGLIADTAEAFAHAVRDVCRNPELHAAISQNARRLVAERFDRPVVERILLDLLRDARSRPPKPLPLARRLDRHVRGSPFGAAKDAIIRHLRWYGERLRGGS